MAYGRGHVKGTRKVTRKEQDWYAPIAAAHLARIEQEYAGQEALLAYWRGSVSASVLTTTPVIVDLARPGDAA